jgi:phospholipid/cholesterol/gamma-HCH transport system substrate-binding protein
MKLNTSIRTALLIVIGLLMLGGLYVLLRPFTPRRVPYIIETDLGVTGLREQSTVFFRGVPVGIVERVSFSPGGFPTVRIEVSVDAKYPLTEHTFARMTAAALTSGLQLELDFSEPGGRVLTPSSTEPSPIRLEPQLMDQIQQSLAAVATRLDATLAGIQGILDVATEERVSRLIDTTNEVLKNLSVGTRDLPETEKQIRAAAASLGALANELKTRTTAVPELIDSATRLSERASAMVERTDATVPRVQTAIDELLAATEQLRELAALLSEDPQALVTGRPRQAPGPGESAR